MAFCNLDRWAHEAARRFPVALLALFLLVSRGAEAATKTVTVQSTAANSSDAYLNQDNDTEKNGTKPELRIKSRSSDTKNRHSIVSIPLPDLTGKTVLQAWLNLAQYGGSNSTPIDARVYALTQSWSEVDVSWRDRAGSLPWSTPGGTRAPHWTSRRLVSSTTTNSVVGWQVGPIVNAWSLGDLPNYGFVIESDHTDPEREVVFRGSEYTSVPANTPQLVIQYTDEPPAIRSGSAEVQPNVVQLGAKNTALNVWLDVQASGSTPSGAATGFDRIDITHAGALRAVALDSLIVSGVSIPLGQVTWKDTGTSVQVTFPKINVVARVQVALHVDVLSSAAVELPVTVDDTATAGAEPQMLWPKNADGVLGNGDSWLLSVSKPVRVDVVPAAVTMANRTCRTFALYGEDDAGNRFPVLADSFLVYNSPELPRGTVDRNGVFCATQVGTTYVLGFYEGLWDNAEVTITPALTPSVTSLTLRNRSGAAVTTLVPQDTMFLDVTLSDGDGFRDVTGLDLSFYFMGHSADREAPAFRGSYRWRRGAVPAFSVVDPAASSWSVVPSLCAVDTTTNSTTPQTVRLAFRPGAIARASASGQWSASVAALSATPPDTTLSSRTGLGASVRFTVAWEDTVGAFTAGGQGATLLPLRDPADGKLDVRLLANSAFSLEAAATDLAGLTSPTDTLKVGSPSKRISWAFNSARTGGGRLDTTYTTLVTGQPASVTENPIAQDLYLWLDHPSSIPAQDYRGQVRVRLYDGAGMRSPVPTIPIVATVSTSGVAAQSALGEVLPHSVQVGVSAQVMTAYMLPTFNLFDTGIDRIRISIPDGYGTPRVTRVRVNGTTVSYTDASQAGVAEARLASNVSYSLLGPQLIEVRFEVATPTELDPDGAEFVMQFDDIGTTRPPQVAIEGNANGTSDGDNWDVVVVEGPIATITVVPDSTRLFPGDTQSFSATAVDAFGHPLNPAFTWSAQGGIGTVSGSGLFTATAVGSGRVIAASGGVGDSARVVVVPTRGVRIQGLSLLASLYQGQDTTALALTLSNLGADSVRLDTLSIRFTRIAPGDGNADFVVTPAAGSPAGIAGLGTAIVRFRVRVSPTAVTGTVSIDARAVLTEVGSGVIVSDDQADTPLTVFLYPGGVTLAAGQLPATLLPGQSAVSLFTVVLTNHYPQTRTLQSLHLTNRTAGPGDQDQLDAELGDVALYKDDGDGVLEAGPDTLLLPTVALSGAATFAPISVVVPSGGTARLLVATSVPLGARDGDVLDLSIDDSTAVTLDRPTFYRSGWPLAPAGSFPIDGMAAAQVALDPVPGSNLVAGTADDLALEVVVPPNGYQADSLQRIAVMDFGTAEAGVDVKRLRVWRDDGDGIFDPAGDAPLGDLVNTGDRWQRTGMLETIPLAGLRLFVTVDVDSLARQGRTVRLGIPFGLDAGFGVRSGNGGPLDKAVENPFERAVSTFDRITLTAALVESTVVRPGARSALLHHFVATNSYAVDRTLTDVAFTNRTSGPGTLKERDAEVEAVTLRVDGDGDGVLDSLAVDPALGTSFFNGGRAVLSGLMVKVPAGASIHFFLTTDVARGARDGDVLSAHVGSGSDVGFLEATTLTAAWPVDSRARISINGMVAAQVTNVGAPGVTLGPGDGPALGLDIVIPANGYSPDVLQGLRIVNRGSATEEDLEELRLWADGGDGTFSAAGGDDQDLGPLARSGSEWRSTVLGRPVGGAGQRLFVSVRAGTSPRDSVTVRLSIPFQGDVEGITMSSGNDGPLDASIDNPQSILISTSPLLASIETSTAASTVGRPIAVRMVVRNAGSEVVSGIAPTSLTVTGPATWDSGPNPSTLDLAPAEADTFVWAYHSTAPGDVQFAAGAEGTGLTSGLTRRATTATSNVHRVYAAAVDLSLFPVQSMPINVTRGQTDVVPFSLTLTNEGGTGSSDIRLRAFRVHLEDDTGAGIVPADLLTRVSVNEGTNVYLTRTALETSGSDVDLSFSSPLTITGQEPVTISLRLDISAAATSPSFRVVVRDSALFVAEDATSGAPVTVRRESGAFPVASGIARLLADATELRVAALPDSSARVARGTDDVLLATLRMENPGLDGITSSVEVTTLGVSVTDTTGTPVGLSLSHLSRLVVRTPFQTYAARAIRTDDGPDLSLLLSPPLVVPVNSPVDVTLAGDIADTARLGWFRIALRPPSTLEARDANSRDTVLVVYATNPISGRSVRVEAEAQSVRAAGTALFPSATLAGEHDLSALRLTLRHAASPGTGRLRLDSLIVQVRDEARSPRVPDAYLDRLRVLLDGVEVANLAGLPSSGGTIPVALGGALLEPGDTTEVLLVVDLSPSAPPSFLELAVGASGIRVADANTGRTARTDGESGTEFPLVSGLTRISSPARDLLAGWQSRMPAALATDGREVSVSALTLRNTAPAGSGAIRIDRIRVRASNPDGSSVPVGAAARRLYAYVGGVLWAESDTLAADSTEATLLAAAPLDVDAGATKTMELRLVARVSPGVAALRLGLDAAGIGVVQPGSALLTVQVSPEPGLSFPFWTESGAFTAASLAASWGNFPNPFAAGREETAFVFYLTGDATVTLRIWTPKGDRVATLLDGASRPAGLYQSDHWDGRNGRGDIVRNGVYIAELIARYADGSSERTRRKVAVVR